MIIFFYIWVTLLIITVVFFIFAGFIEKNFDENHPVKKWWRKHVVAEAPKDIDI
jgi:hypothetical protein